MDRLSPERLEDLLASAAGRRVLVVGDLMLDRYISVLHAHVALHGPE